MNRAQSPGSIGGDHPHRDLAKRFLQYFQDLPVNPKGAALDITALPDDWRVLFSLAYGFCISARQLDKPVGGHWTARKKHCSQLIASLPHVFEVSSNFLREHIWLETRSNVCGIGQESADETFSLDEDIRQVRQLLNSIEFLRKRIPIVEGAHKPRADDDANFSLFVMAAFLKVRGATIETAIHQEIADFVNALLDAAEKKDVLPLDRGDVKRRIGRFRGRKATLAQRIEIDPLKYVLRETDIVLTTKLPKS